MNRGERMMQDTMVGKKFGNLVVQKLAYRGKDSKKYWECQCGCGRVCLVQESHLKNGHTKSCGCLRKKRMTNRWLDLTGQRYGRLVVQRLANQDEISAYGLVLLTQVFRHAMRSTQVPSTK